MITVHCIASLKGGGAEKQFCYLLKGLQKKGLTCHAIIINDGINLPLLTDNDIQVHYIKAKSFYDPYILYQLIKLIHQINPDLVEVWQRPMDFFASLASIILRIPFVAIERTDPKRFEKGLKATLRKILTKKAGGVISNSAAGKQYWEKYDQLKTKCLQVPNILDFNKIETVVQNKTEDYIIYVGRLNPAKNVTTLIEAFSLVSSKFPKLNLYILGGGDLLEELKIKTDNLLISDKVKFLGYIDSPYQYISSARLFISLSLFEGMPNTVIEAAAVKAPLLLSDIVQHCEVFDSSSALYVDPMDKLDVARKIEFALNQGNFETIETLKTNALAKVISFNEANVSQLYFDFYNQILKNTSDKV